MVVNIVDVQVKPENVADFVAATRANHEGSRKEPGNLRFDVLQGAEDPARFVLYEVFASQEAVEAHRASPHYLDWRSKVEPWMARPRQGRSHRVIVPEDPGAW
jgi:autoinducer 2-degrading protein